MQALFPRSIKIPGLLEHVYADLWEYLFIVKL